MSLQEKLARWQDILSVGGSREVVMILDAAGKLRGTEDDSLVISFLLYASERARGFKSEFYWLAEKLELSRLKRYEAAMAELRSMGELTEATA